MNRDSNLKKRSRKTRLIKGDSVVVIAGKDKGKQGKILKVNLAEQKVIVENVNMSKRHSKATQTQEGGIIEKESLIHISNVALLDPGTGNATRIGVKFLEDGRKVRKSISTGEVLDQ
jgi:large subunit ribosomal protein L24